MVVYGTGGKWESVWCLGGFATGDVGLRGEQGPDRGRGKLGGRWSGWDFVTWMRDSSVIQVLNSDGGVARVR
jgi:hypothetical protein